MVEQLKYYVENGITTIIVTGSEPAMIDMVGLTITAISEAIYRLSEDSSHDGKIDLILPDVTEIVDKEFYDRKVIENEVLSSLISKRNAP